MSILHASLRVTPRTLAFLLVMSMLGTPVARAQAPAAADTVVLRSGTRVAGRIVESNPPNYVVITRATGATETLMWSDVRRVVRTAAAAPATATPPTAFARTEPTARPATPEPARRDSAAAHNAAVTSAPPPEPSSVAKGTATTSRRAMHFAPRGFVFFTYGSAGQFGYGFAGRYLQSRVSATTFAGLAGPACGYSCSDVSAIDRNPRNLRLDANTAAIGPVLPLNRNVLLFAEIGMRQTALSAQFDGGRRVYNTGLSAVFGGGMHLRAGSHVAVSGGYSTSDALFASVGFR